MPFLQLYDAREAPILKSAVIRAAAPVIYQSAMGFSGVTLPRDRIQEQPTCAGAREAFEALEPVRVLFDNGAGGTSAGQPYPAFEHSFSQWRIATREPRAWYLSADGALADEPPREARADAFT